MLDCTHPDAALLILCGELRVLQEEWQRLWSVTAETLDATSPAELAFDDYAEHVWPGLRLADEQSDQDLVRQLGAIRATTLEGMRAKAAAIKAVDDACGYSTCCRDDYCELLTSLLEDVAGPAAMRLGEDADRIAAVAGE